MNLNKITDIKNYVNKIVQQKKKTHRVYCCFVGDIEGDGYVATTFYVNKKASFINLSWQKWLIMSNYQKKKAIVHEMCHVLAYLDGEKDGHGQIWSTYMKRFGYRPDITMRV